MSEISCGETPRRCSAYPVISIASSSSPTTTSFEPGEGARPGILEALDPADRRRAGAEGVDPTQNDRIHDDAQDRGGDEQIVRVAREYSETAIDLGEHERELADLRESRSDDERDADRKAEDK